MSDANQNTDFLDFLKEDYEVLPDDRHPAINEIESRLPSISNLSLIAKNLAVADIVTCNQALDMTTDIKMIYKSIEELRKKAIEPARKIVQIINDCAKGLLEILSKTEVELKIKIATYQLEEKKKMDAIQESVKALSEQLGVEIVIPSDDKSMKSDKAMSYFKKTMGFEIVDSNLIPDEYWIIDEKAIQKHVDLGKSDIPGIRIVKSKKFIVRRK